MLGKVEKQLYTSKKKGKNILISNAYYFSLELGPVIGVELRR